MDLTIYNEHTQATQNIVINDFNDLQMLIEAYFGIPSYNQIIKLNDLPLSMTNLHAGDTLFINDTNNETMMINSYIRHTHVYIKMEYNNLSFKMMIDSGADSNVMSYTMASALGLRDKIDTSRNGIAHGVGTSKIYGCIYACKMKIKENVWITCNFTVLANPDKYLIILGLDFLYNHRCNINFANRSLQFNNEMVYFMNEKEVDTHIGLINVKDNMIKNAYYNMLDKIPNCNKENIEAMIKKIITNIIINPNNDKYKIINMDSNFFQDSLGKHDECISYMNDIGFMVTIDKKMKFENDIESLHILRNIICV